MMKRIIYIAFFIKLILLTSCCSWGQNIIPKDSILKYLCDCEPELVAERFPYYGMSSEAYLMKYLTNKLNENPKNSKYLRERADLKRIEYHDYRGAILDYTKAIEINSKNDLAYLGISICKFNLKDTTGAINAISKAIEIIPITNEKYFLLRARYKFLMLDYDGAITDCKKAVEITPKSDYHVFPYISIGLLELNYGDKNNGCINLSKAGEFGLSDAFKLIKQYCQ